MCIIDCLSTIVFILPLHLDYTKVIILILWWRNFQLEYWRTFQLVSTFTPKKGLTESEKRELMSNDGCVPDPDFSRALTFEELNNVADVLISGTDDRKKIRNAAETLYQLQDTDLFSFFSTELSTQSQLEKLLKENMPNGKETSKQSLEQIGIDWNKYM
ncbi:DUF4122 domain-containing protein [Phocaeicola vulgatus]|uniref:DUF4122 domain-containing protein n=1 Tax=Phocaeicola vulgatus TaxID=821 RepID=UPI000AAA0B1D|nr:DUF4122 domain-containing protein [Phocaeicola vulgatus]